MTVRGRVAALVLLCGGVIASAIFAARGHTSTEMPRAAPSGPPGVATTSREGDGGARTLPVPAPTVLRPGPAIADGAAPPPIAAYTSGPATADPRLTAFFEDQVRADWAVRTQPIVEEEMRHVAERVGMQATSIECRGTMCLAVFSATSPLPTVEAVRSVVSSDLSVHCTRELFASPDGDDAGIASAYVLLHCRE